MRRNILPDMIGLSKNQIILMTLLNNSLFDDQEFYALVLSTNEYFRVCQIFRRKLNESHMNFAHTIQEDIFQTIIKLINQSFDGSSDTWVVSGGLAQNSSLIA